MKVIAVNGKILLANGKAVKPTEVKADNFVDTICEVAGNNIISSNWSPSVTAEEHIPKKYYYNGVLLPEIPVIGYENCPYLMILRLMETNGIYLYGSTSKPYYQVKDSVNRLELPSGRTRSLYNDDTDSWGASNANTTATFCQLVNKWEILWSSHDIPNGSATATEIYFEGSEPVLAE